MTVTYQDYLLFVYNNFIYYIITMSSSLKKHILKQEWAFSNQSNKTEHFEKFQQL